MDATRANADAAASRVCSMQARGALGVSVKTSFEVAIAMPERQHVIAWSERGRGRSGSGGQEKVR